MIITIIRYYHYSHEILIIIRYIMHFLIYIIITCIFSQNIVVYVILYGVANF